MKRYMSYLLIIFMFVAMTGCGKQELNTDVKGKILFFSNRKKPGVYLIKENKIKCIIKDMNYPRWSRDGKKIAALGEKNVGIYDERGSLLKNIVLAGRPLLVDWTRDEEIIFLERRVSEKSSFIVRTYDFNIMKYDLKNDTLQTIKVYSNKPLIFVIPTLYVSHDGKKVLFASGDNYLDQKTYILDLSNGAMKNIWGSSIPLSWLSDDTRVLFFTNLDNEGKQLDGKGRFVVKNINTGKIQDIEYTSDVFYGDNIRLTPDNKYLIYTKAYVNNNGRGYQIMMTKFDDKLFDEETEVTYQMYINKRFKNAKNLNPDFYEEAV